MTICEFSFYEFENQKHINTVSHFLIITHNALLVNEIIKNKLQEDLKLTIQNTKNTVKKNS